MLLWVYRCNRCTVQLYKVLVIHRQCNRFPVIKNSTLILLSQAESRKVLNLPPCKISSSQCFSSLRLGYILRWFELVFTFRDREDLFNQIILNASRKTLGCY